MDKQQQVRDFLEKTIKEKGFSLNALSLQLGKNSTYLFHFIKRHSPRRLDEESRRSLARILDIDEQSLCDFPLPSNPLQDKLSSLYGLFNFNKEKTTDFTALDVIDMNGPKHGRFDQIQHNLIGHQLLSPAVFKACGLMNPDKLKIIKLAGDAMEPTLSAGDFLWVDTSFNTPQTDGIYLLETAGDVVVRRLQMNPFENSIEVSADNKAYTPYKIEEKTKLRICGKVVSVTHLLS